MTRRIPFRMGRKRISRSGALRSGLLHDAAREDPAQAGTRSEMIPPDAFGRKLRLPIGRKCMVGKCQRKRVNRNKALDGYRFRR